MRTAAKALSTVLHPMLIPTIGLFLIFNLGGHFSYLPFEHKRLIYLFVFISTCALPVSLIPLFMLLGVVKSVYMTDRKERLWPTLFTSIFYGIGYFFLSRIPIVPSFIQGFMLATIIVILMALGITIFWKISMHMIGIGGLCGALLALALTFGLDLWVVFILAISIAGALGSARLYLNAHTPLQVHVGFLLGAGVVFCGSLFL
ncbi:PAP2 family protein [Carboxylicivirga marina]|uniref:PAP2 family protein n=1 Tax=Carboxylicivirga marina TaxID=2800988 RepID=A0ABS1HIZ8_9BACT|nr:PAP2 family protein [Carboxylicivirga marina]MBK3517273.1 PAP2 family protein [Carboxylicivirga marina]